MKVKQNKYAFQPVIITLETAEEADAMWYLIDKATLDGKLSAEQLKTAEEFLKMFVERLVVPR